MSELRDLYQELIIDHSKRPHNRRKMEAPDRHAEGFNPLCGDRVTVYLKLDGDRIADVSFEGVGCAISTSSASLMTDALKGKTSGEARVLFERFHEMVTGQGEPTLESMGKLAVLSGVKEFPVRVKCASLAWHTLKAALTQQDDVVTTE